MKSSFMCPPAPNSVVKQHHSRAGGTWAAPSNYGYNIFLPRQTPRALDGSLAQEVVTADAFIGTANNYLYRVILEERGDIQELGTRRSDKTPLLSNVVYNYSAFDQPVTITAPAGAVPADRSTPNPNPTNPLGTIAGSVGLDPDDPLNARVAALVFGPGLLIEP